MKGGDCGKMRARKLPFGRKEKDVQRAKNPSEEKKMRGAGVMNSHTWFRGPNEAEEKKNNVFAI